MSDPNGPRSVPTPPAEVKTEAEAVAVLAERLRYLIAPDQVVELRRWTSAAARAARIPPRGSSTANT